MIPVDFEKLGPALAKADAEIVKALNVLADLVIELREENEELEQQVYELATMLADPEGQTKH